MQTQSVMQDYSVSFSTAGDVFFFYEGAKKHRAFLNAVTPAVPTLHCRRRRWWVEQGGGRLAPAAFAI